MLRMYSSLPMRQQLKRTQQQLSQLHFSSSSSSKASGPFARAWTKYNVLLETHPLATKIVTGGAIAGIGDINCQLFLESGQFNIKRAAIFTFLGGAFISPILHVWYGFLGSKLPGISNAVR